MKTFEDLVAFLLEHDCRIFVKQYSTWISGIIKCRGVMVEYISLSGNSCLISIGSTTRKQLYKNILKWSSGKILVVNGHTIGHIPHLEVS